MLTGVMLTVVGVPGGAPASMFRLPPMIAQPAGHYAGKNVVINTNSSTHAAATMRSRAAAGPDRACRGIPRGWQQGGRGASLPALKRGHSAGWIQ